MGWPSKNLRSVMREAVAVCMLAGVCVQLGVQVLGDWGGPSFTLSNEMYVPAALFASGRGFINPPLEEAPGLRAFLRFEDDARCWEAGALPDRFSRTDLDAHQTYHRYLILAMGLVWRVFGISWASAKILVIAVFIAATLAAYALFRNGMGRLLAALGAAAFAASPLVLDLVYDVRDFSKAPFILLMLALLFFLVRRCRSRRGWFLACVALGLCVGIGLGFRRDLLVCPPAVVAVLLVAPRPARWAVLDRAGGIACFLVVLLVAAAPIVASFRAHGSLVHHDMVMGLATEHDHRLGLGAASYEKLPLKQDLYVTQASDAYHMRSHLPEPVPALITGNPTKAYFYEMVRMFPADLLTRAYQAVWRVGQGVDHGTYTPQDPVQWPRPAIDPFVRYVNTYGPWHIAAALVLLAAFHLRAALVTAGLLVYFGGLTSLQYEARHALHMLAATYGLLLLPLGLLDTVHWRAVFERWRAGTVPFRRAFLRCGVCVLVFCSVIVVVLGAPLAVVRVLQHHNVAEYEARIEAAEKTPIPFRRQTVDYGLLFRPEPPLLVQPGRVPVTACVPLAGYLMVELEPFDAPMPLWVAYESMGGQTNYGTVLRAWPVETAPPETVRYYFPIINFQCGVGWSRFCGVGIAGKYGDKLRGLYLVETGGLPLHLNFAIGEGTPTVRAQLFSFGVWEPDWLRTVPAPEQPHRAMRDAYMAMDRGELDTARALIDAYPMAQAFPMETLQARADWLAGAERNADALEVLAEGMQRWPRDLNFALNAHQKMRDTCADAERLIFWQQATETAPDSIAVWFILGQYYEARGTYAEAHDAYQHAQALAQDQFNLSPYMVRLTKDRVTCQCTEEAGG